MELYDDDVIPENELWDIYKDVTLEECIGNYMDLINNALSCINTIYNANITFVFMYNMYSLMAEDQTELEFEKFRACNADESNIFMERHITTLQTDFIKLKHRINSNDNMIRKYEMHIEPCDDYKDVLDIFSASELDLEINTLNRYLKDNSQEFKIWKDVQELICEVITTLRTSYKYTIGAAKYVPISNTIN